ncbi:MAG: hypothetical protein ACPLXM_11760 [Bacteroidales bacterium]
MKTYENAYFRTGNPFSGKCSNFTWISCYRLSCLFNGQLVISVASNQKELCQLVNLYFMKNLSFIFTLCLLMTVGCKKDKDREPAVSDIWDIDKQGIPEFVNTNYIDIAKIQRVSRFRSSVGHDYSDAFEHCRSMKHYFQPADSVNWSEVKIFFPVTGEITRVEQEWAGTKIEIAAEKYPAFRFQIFHINMAVALKIGDKVTEGLLLGKHIGAETYSDISVIVNDPTRQGRMVSYFDVLTDEAYQAFVLRGIPNRSAFIISKEERDQNPLVCNGDTFTSQDPLENWVILQ